MSRAFRLAGLLRLRRLEEEQAAAGLAVANAATRQATVEHERRTVVLAQAVFPDHADDAVWGAVVASRAATAGLVDEAVIAVQVATRRAELAADDWSAARARMSMLDKLATRHAVLVAAEEERAEQLVLDEVASRRRSEDVR